MSDDETNVKQVKVWDFTGPEPVWLKCECGTLTSRVPCWDCNRAAIAKLDAVRENMQSAGTIPKRFASARLSGPELAQRVKAREPLECIAQRVLAATRVVFAGGSGSGKTSLACACLRERVPHGIFMSALRLGVARSQSSLGDGEPAEVVRALTAPLLLIDELGGEAKTPTNAIRDVLFARYERELPTWVTTGFMRKQLQEIYGDGALRRLTEDAYIVWLGPIAKPVAAA